MGIACKPVIPISYPENEGKETTGGQNIPFMAQSSRSQEPGSQWVTKADLFVVNARVRRLSRQSHPWPPVGRFEDIICREA